jgi:hypothetical protein
VGARFNAPGWFLVGANPAVVTGSSPPAHSRSGTILVAIAAGLLAVIVVVAARLIAARRRER